MIMPKRENNVAKNRKQAKQAASRSASAVAQPAETGYQQVFKRVDNTLRKDQGCTSELDYTEQSSWLLFLKYLDALEQEREVEAELEGKRYSHILEKKFRWGVWAAPKNSAGEIDRNATLTGDDLIKFVNEELFPYLSKFKTISASSDTIEYKIGEIFDEVRNRLRSGYAMREVIDALDTLQFRSQDQKHELSELYEVKIKNMGNAGRSGGEYYTPRPLIRAIVKVVDPQIGETVYDPAVGSAGFLCEAFEHMKRKADNVKKNQVLQESTFFGKEKKSLAYVIGIMNMILHGIDAPNLLHVNTLSENVAQIQERDRHHVVLANPPFGGKEFAAIQENFPIRSSETAYLFLQHFIKALKANGRAGVVIKNTFLSNMDNASVELRRHLLTSCNLHTILDLPSGTFQGAGVRTVVLFFEKGVSTKKVWFYQLNPGRNLGKINPLNDADLAEFVQLQKMKTDSANSWMIDVVDLNQDTWELTVRNPNAEGPAELGTPTEIVAELEALDQEAAALVTKLKGLLK
jgi:type I restriction enzyme M protein